MFNNARADQVAVPTNPVQSENRITSLDLRIIEKVLDMSDGYVLQFSNNSFAGFFSDFDVDIDDESFIANGRSKANRLRTFLRGAEPELVATVLSALLELRLDREPQPGEVDIQRFRRIIERISGVPDRQEMPKSCLAPGLSAETNVPEAPQRRTAEQGPEAVPACLDDLPHYDLEQQPWWGRRPQIINPSEHPTVVVDIGLLVAVDVELEAVLRILEPLEGIGGLLQIPVGPDTCYLGRLGHHVAAVSQCTTKGSGGPGGSLLTAHRMCGRWHPKAIIMPGIAFGADPTSMSIGDVLVSQRVVCYEIQRVGPEQRITERGDQPQAGQTLLNRFQNTHGWQFVRPDGKPVARRVGPLLSGDKLVDDPDFKQQLLTRFPTAIGGEMEGVGIWAGVDQYKVEWIVVKGICDWGEAKSKKHQALAASAAASLVLWALKSPLSLDGLSRAPHNQEQEATPQKASVRLTEVETEVYYAISEHFRTTSFSSATSGKYVPTRNIVNSGLSEVSV